MAKPPEHDRVGKKEKTKMKQKRGSKRYIHLRNFIERRREKKLQKWRTLDPCAQVILLMTLVMMIMMRWCKLQLIADDEGTRRVDGDGGEG